MCATILPLPSSAAAEKSRPKSNIRPAIARSRTRMLRDASRLDIHSVDITTIKIWRRLRANMLAADPYRNSRICTHESEMLEIHRTVISQHHAKAGYDYPTIRLPFAFSALVGLSTRIFQTMHDGALAFLVVVSSSNKREEESSMKSENPTMDLRSPPLHGEGRAFESPRAHSFCNQER
jgi:hypothetical protein